MIPLDRAVRAEEKAGGLLVAAEYNRLAVLASSVWDYDKTKGYVDKALATKGPTPLDCFFSRLVLGHITFKSLSSDSGAEKTEAARREFRDAIDCLHKASQNDTIQYHEGLGYSIWAAHEAFLKHDLDSNQAKEHATAAWSKLPNSARWIVRMNEQIHRAKTGIRPEIACLFGPPEERDSCAAPGAPVSPGNPAAYANATAGHRATAGPAAHGVSRRAPLYLRRIPGHCRTRRAPGSPVNGADPSRNGGSCHTQRPGTSRA